MGGSRFNDLVAYRLSRSVARDLHAAVVQWDKLELWTVGVKLVRAADSVGANIAEAVGRFHPADQRRILLIARGSLFETEHWLACAAERGLIDAAPFDQRMAEIARTLAGLIRQAQRS